MNKFVKIASGLVFASVVAVASIGSSFAYSGRNTNAATPTAQTQCARPDRTVMATALATALGVDVQTVQNMAQNRHQNGQAPWEALGVTQEAFEAAQETVHKDFLAQAVASGCMTQAQADEIVAKHELRRLGTQIFGHDEAQAVIADLLGVDVADLAGADVRQLLQDAGLTREAVHTALNTARTAAIDAAVSDGTITAEQATQLKAAPTGHGGRGGRGGHGEHGGRGERGGFPQGAPAAPQGFGGPGF